MSNFGRNGIMISTLLMERQLKTHIVCVEWTRRRPTSLSPHTASYASLHGYWRPRCQDDYTNTASDKSSWDYLHLCPASYNSLCKLEETCRMRSRQSSKGGFWMHLLTGQFLPELFHNICGLKESCFLRSHKTHVHNRKMYNN